MLHRIFERTERRLHVRQRVEACPCGRHGLQSDDGQAQAIAFPCVQCTPGSLLTIALHTDQTVIGLAPFIECGAVLHERAFHLSDGLRLQRFEV